MKFTYEETEGLTSELSNDSVRAIYKLFDVALDTLALNVLQCTTSDERARDKLLIAKSQLEGGQRLFSLIKQELTRLRSKPDRAE